MELPNEDLKQYIQDLIDSKKFALPVTIMNFQESYLGYTFLLGWLFQNQRHALALRFRESDPTFKQQIQEFIEYIESSIDYLVSPEDFELRKSSLAPNGVVFKRIKPKVAS